MAKNRNLIKNASYNFKLRKRPSIFIGLYVILGTLFIKTTITGFTTDSSPFGFLTVNFLEGFIFIITFLVFLFSLLALFFGSRRDTRKVGNQVWNQNSRKQLWSFLFLIFLMYNLQFYLLRNGMEAFMIPSFLISNGLVLFILNFSKTKQLYFFSVLSILLGFLPLFISDFGYNTLLLFGFSYVTFGFLAQKKSKNFS